MADTTSKVAVVLSAVAIAVSASVAYLQLQVQTQLQSTTAKANFELSGAQQGMAAAQVCLNWAGFVDTQRRNGFSDPQIDRLGQVVFAPADLVLQAVATHARIVPPLAATRATLDVYGALGAPLRASCWRRSTSLTALAGVPLAVRLARRARGAGALV